MTYRRRHHLLSAVLWWAALIYLVAFWWVAGAILYHALAHDAIPTQAQPLGWRYDWECCSIADCARVDKRNVTEGPEGVTVRLAKGDHPMLLWDAEITIPYSSKQLRISKDGDFHVCHDRQFLKPDGSKYEGKFLCVYLPPRGF